MTANNPTSAAAVCPSYNELQQLLAHLVANGPAEQVLPLALRQLSQPLVLSGLLTGIAHQPQWLSRVQQASYYHRNGFDKLVLLQGQTYKLRLHHFRPNGGELPSENIHDHRWPFASAVISGRLHMNLFETHPTLGQPVQEYQYTSNRTDETLRAVPVGANRLRTCDYLVYEAGTQYFMPTTALHQIVYVPGQQALTLVLTGKPERSTCRLFAKEVLEPEDMDEILYTGAFLRKKLLVLAKHIQTLS